MYSHKWKLLRKVTATTSFAILGLTAQSGFSQDGQWQAPDHRRPVEAKIRIKSDTTLPKVGESNFRLAPEQNATKPTLVQSRFAGFPNAESNAIQAGVKQVTAIIPVKRQETDVVQVPAGTTPTPAVAQNQDDGQQGITIDPSSTQFQGLKGTVKIIIDEKTNAISVIGDPADVAIVERQIGLLQRTTETEDRLPERIPLRFSRSEDIVESIRQIYDDNYSGKTGKAAIEAIASPNALLVFGNQKAIDSVREIVTKIESDLPEEAAKDFASFKLKHLSAADAKRRLDDFFTRGDVNQNAPVTNYSVVADYRSNVVVVRGDAQVVQQAKLLIAAIDIDEEALSTKSIKVYQLQNAVAGDLTIILQDAINGALKNVSQPLVANAQGGGLQPGQPGADGNEFSSEVAPSKLQLQTIGSNGEVVTSGLLFDVRITPDSASNSIIVRAPESAMALIEELISQLDRLPDAETLIKVFKIVNGDAEQLLTMLESIFGADDAQGGNFNQTGGLAQLPLQTSSTTPGAALVNLRFAIDQRTNSIIATGPAGDLQVIEDLLNRLDEDLRSRRQTVVYRLSNANVLDVHEALDALLESRSDVISEDPRTAGGSVLADQEIVIVPEFGSNSLIISALPENWPEIESIIDRLDRRPPMVKVKVLMAEVSLGSLEEFGVELGLQDSLLFDRGTTVNGAGGAINGTGFNFNGAGFPNQNGLFPGTLAGQALSNLNIGRTNAELGYGGLVLSAGSESISVLLRALKDRNCLRVLSRPHIMTLENLQGRVSVGQSVPRITNSTQNQFGGVSNGVEDRDVGVILEITPRVSPDGMITMFTNIVKSSLGQEEDGVAVAVNSDGTVVRQAPINATEAQTTIMARSGQTIVFSGLIQETKEHAERGAPILSDLPVIGPLFKFESDNAVRTELLIIMTPYLVDTDGVIEAQNTDEMERMNWCLCDVAEVYGSTDGDIGRFDQGVAPAGYPVQDGGVFLNSDPSAGQPLTGATESIETTVDAPKVKQTSFLNKMKIGMPSPVARIADRIRGNNRPNVNDRNRRDFEELKQLPNQRQE